MRHEHSNLVAEVADGQVVVAVPRRSRYGFPELEDATRDLVSLLAAGHRP